MARRSVAGIAIKADRILVAKRKEGGTLGLRWEFPGGKVESGENDEEALVREFEEELGVEIRPLRQLGTSSFYGASGESLLSAWLVKLSSENDFILREHCDIAWVKREELSSLDLVESDRSVLPLIDGALRQDFSR